VRGTIAVSEQNRNRTGSRVAVAAFLLFVGLLLWYLWPSATVESIQKRLNREVPVGTPRAETEEWLKRQRIEYSYSQDFRYNSVLEQNGVEPGTYSGYTAAIIRNTDRGFFVTGSIQFYLLFDDKDQVAKHIVKWIGTGP
jgi:hypothetical protein